MIRSLLGRRGPDLTLPGLPGASYLYCGLCGEILHETLPGYIHGQEVIACSLEASVQAHLVARHGLRFKLWQRLGWRWLIAGLCS